LGHSFGARLVSYALAGLPDGLSGEKSPVKMLFLLQGAFSHFAFAEKLPFDGTRSGDLNGMAQRVDGPLLATFSSKDTAVGVAYPAAAVLAGQDASDATDLMYRWEGMGCDGAQEVDAAIKALEPFPVVYPFKAGEWLNLDGNEVIICRWTTEWRSQRHCSPRDRVGSCSRLLVWSPNGYSLSCKDRALPSDVVGILGS